MKDQTACEKAYKEQCRRISEKLTGKKMGRKTIIEVGEPIFEHWNCPSLTPVKFNNGTYGIFWDVGRMKLLQSDNKKLNVAIRNSTKMPEVGPGIGSDVVYIQTYPKGCHHAFSKVYYNFKAGSGDTFKRISE